MLKVKDVEVCTKEVLDVLIALKEKQKEIVNTELIYYSYASFYLALKNKIFFKNLFLHPISLKKKKFYEEKLVIKTENEFIKFLQDIIEYELMESESFLTNEERNKIIKLFKKKQSKISKLKLKENG